MHGFSPRYDAALVLAAQAHRNQVRKSTDIPYVTHVVHVSVLLIRHGFGEDLVIAGLLHDAVEDCDLPIDLVANTFGPEVARLVGAVSETKRADGVELPWEQRKREGLAHLRAGAPDVAALKAADAIHNARSISADLGTSGAAVWARFNRGPDETLWYYREILAAVQAKLGDHPLALELADAVAELAARAEGRR